MHPPICFTSNPLDRQSAHRGNDDWRLERLRDPDSRFLLVSGDLKAFVDPRRPDGPRIAWVSNAQILDLLVPQRGDPAPCIFLGEAEGLAHFAIDAAGLDRADPSWGGKFIDVRSIAGALPVEESGILAQARSIVDWHRRHGHCAVCGAPTEVADGGYKRACSDSACAAEHFPRTDPVVIMLVIRDGRCLLGRQPRFPKGVFSALAGFVEPGESIEDAVRREIDEEAGIAVGKVRYIASQPWPYPSSLMIGCVGEGISEEIEVDGEELDEARWFSRDEVAAMIAASEDMQAPLRMPPALSLAHQLARRWLDGDADL
ncbi:NAD(+) diphosphatase [Marinibaculum pumilum]|uniref:NAD(+) diphosphatase n=1 Tax=Marinibaculum pumilum TaxID=1766165 RepID=A0ABV7L699_9PROT